MIFVGKRMKNGNHIIMILDYLNVKYILRDLCQEVKNKMEDIFKNTEKERNDLFNQIEFFRDRGDSWGLIAESLNKPKSTLRSIYDKGIKVCEGVCENKPKTAQSVRNPNLFDIDEDLIKALILEIDYINKHLWKKDHAYKSPFGKQIHLLSIKLNEGIPPKEEIKGEKDK